MVVPLPIRTHSGDSNWSVISLRTVWALEALEDDIRSRVTPIGHPLLLGLFYQVELVFELLEAKLE